MSADQLPRDLKVSIRALARGRTGPGRRSGKGTERFNPRPRTRANSTPARRSASLPAFQSAPSHEGEPKIRHRSPIGTISFNPRPRTRANKPKPKPPEPKPVSIRALARGRTGRLPWIRHAHDVSIRALARGRTPLFQFVLIEVAFQSAPSHEGELVVDGLRVTRGPVSIRALARGRTPPEVRRPRGRHSFNPRPRTRANELAWA